MIACAGESPEAAADELSDENEVRGAKADPIGTFTSESTEKDVFGPGTFDATSRLSLTLKTDKTYRLGVRTTCKPAPCPAIAVQAGTVEESGTYELTKKSRVRYIRFVGSAIFEQRYAYTFDGTTLKSTGDADNREDVVIRSPDAWCAAPTDCAMQNLTGAEWQCVANVCKAR